MPQVVILIYVTTKIEQPLRKNNSKYWEIIHQRNEKDTVKNVFNKNKAIIKRGTEYSSDDKIKKLAKWPT